MIKHLLFSCLAAIFSIVGVTHAATYTQTTVPVDFVDLSGTGAPLSLSDDAITGPISIGFDFDFYGVRHSSLRVSANGFISFRNDQGSGCCSGRAIPGADGVDGIIAAGWTDLYPPGGEVVYATLGSPGERVFVLMFKNVSQFGGAANNTFNIKLFEGNNRIEIHIVTANPPGKTVSIGIENEDGTEGVQTYRGTSPPSNVAYAYSLFAPCLTVLGDGVEIPAGAVDVDPANLTDLGVVSSSAPTVKRTFVLRNHGNDVLNLTGDEPVTIPDSPAFVVTRQPLSPIEENGGESEVEITFLPGAAGEYRATIEIASDDPLNDPYTFVLAARVADPMLSVSRIDRFASTTVGKSGKPRRVLVKNTGEVPVTGLHAKLLGKGAGDFLITAPTSRVLQPGETAQLLVSFQPRSAGMRKAILEIRSDADVERIPLAGRAEASGRAVNSPRFPRL